MNFLKEWLFELGYFLLIVLLIVGPIWLFAIFNANGYFLLIYIIYGIAIHARFVYERVKRRG